ncbi:MAG: thioredoxin-disulfide reductase [Candidatus Bipolaricaulia bacterium]
MERERYDMIIIGAGPAGLTAGLYCGRSRLKTLILEAVIPGGTLTKTEKIEDYPGFEEITGQQLAARMEGQTRKFGAEIKSESVVKVLWEAKTKLVKTEEAEYEAGAVIIAAGGWPKQLNVPGEQELTGRGCSYCALCDGPFFQDQEITVIGGGDSAVEEAIFLTKYASKVTIIHRRDTFRAQKAIQEKAFQNPKIEVLWNTVVEEIQGEDGVEALVLKNVRSGERKKLDVKGVFIFIGFVPNQVKGMHPNHDKGGFLVADERMETSCPGIFAVGDIRSQPVRQITNATGDGTVAAVMAEEYLEEHNLRVKS